MGLGIVKPVKKLNRDSCRGNYLLRNNIGCSGITLDLTSTQKTKRKKKNKIAIKSRNKNR